MVDWEYNIQNFNKALLAKVGWNLLKGDKQWLLMTKVKYLQNGY